MAVKKIFIILVIMAFMLSSNSAAYAYLEIPKFLCEMGLRFYQEGRIPEALQEFKKALLAKPNYEPALRYIEMIEKQQGEVMPLLPEKPDILKPQAMDRELEVQEFLDMVEKGITPGILPGAAPKLKQKIAPKEKKAAEQKAKIFYLNDELWLTQTKPDITMDIGESVTLQGKNIKRYLVVSPGFLDLKRVDKDTIVLTAGLRKGFTFLHVWDDHGRWTFPVSAVFPKSMFYPLEQEIEEGVQPFRLTYAADWNSYYSGSSVGTMDRESLAFSQWVGIAGDSPYGKLDSSVVFTKFKESTEVTSYTAGLANGQVGPFRNFNLRAVDQYKYFSPLSLLGTGLRGGSLQAKAFDDIIGYDLLWGRRRLVYGFVAPGVQTKRADFIQGARATLFPLKENNYSFNYAHGYGSAREPFLKDTVVSLEANQTIKNARLSSESAFDGEKFASFINTRFVKDNLRLGLELRNLEKDFTTITSSPGGAGEIGGRLTLDQRFSDIYLSSDLDVYRDRAFFNPGKEHKPNFDWNSSVFVPLTSSSEWKTGLYYTNTPGLLSPARNLRVNNIYTKRHNFFNNKKLTWYLGNSYQRTRYPLSPSSSYDRYALLEGLNFPLLGDLFASLDYEHSWAEAYLSKENSLSGVLKMGLNYNKQISPSLFGNMNVYYRDEENTEAPFSFLAGEDSLQTILGLTYRPSPDIEVFLNGSLTNIWAENPERQSFDSASIGWGVRLGWDLPFGWNPLGQIEGIVFDDKNGNTVKDKDEKVVPGIIIRVGRKEVVTDQKGKYSASIRAKKATVALDVESIPKNNILSTQSVHTIEITNGKTYRVNFGLTTNSGILGAVYFDKNGNGKPDAEDEFVPKTKIILDNKETSVTDDEGKFFFLNIPAGKHALTININSLPLEYLPLIKVTNTVEVREGDIHIFNIPLKAKN